MDSPTLETRERYVGYAEQCVRMAKRAEDPETREVLRDMAAEWLKLAECTRH